MSYIAWHFAKDDYTMNYGDGRKLEVGKTYRTIWPCNNKNEPTLCEAGMHGSFNALDALDYAPGSVVCLTEIYGNVKIGSDKIVGESRKILAMMDGEEILREFARKCALDVIHLWDAPQVVIDYLKTGDERIRDAAKDAAGAAAGAAAGDAAWAAARDAAWAAAWDSQNKRLEEMLYRELNFNNQKGEVR